MHVFLQSVSAFRHGEMEEEEEEEDTTEGEEEDFWIHSRAISFQRSRWQEMCFSIREGRGGEKNSKSFSAEDFEREKLAETKKKTQENFFHAPQLHSIFPVLKCLSIKPWRISREKTYILPPFGFLPSNRLRFP